MLCIRNYYKDRVLAPFVVNNAKRDQVRVALISDTHGVLDERIAELIRRCDAVVHAGDIGGSKVLQALTPRFGLVVAIKGNNDVAAKWPRDETQFLLGLEEHAYLDLPGGRLAVVHGDQFNPVRRRHEKLRQAFGDARAIVYGHSHRLTIDDNQIPWILNPGAAGRSRTYGGPSCLVLTATAANWKLETQRFQSTPAHH